VTGLRTVVQKQVAFRVWTGAVETVMLARGVSRLERGLEGMSSTAVWPGRKCMMGPDLSSAPDCKMHGMLAGSLLRRTPTFTTAASLSSAVVSVRSPFVSGHAGTGSAFNIEAFPAAAAVATCTTPKTEPPPFPCSRSHRSYHASTSPPRWLLPLLAPCCACRPMRAATPSKRCACGRETGLSCVMAGDG
jgi:hypothetical protein